MTDHIVSDHFPDPTLNKHFFYVHIYTTTHCDAIKNNQLSAFQKRDRHL